jgi:iron complex transport system ATP-binding protein
MRLEIDNLTAGYGRQEVLRGISLAVEPGEVLAILGANGSGKSTLLRAAAGQLPHRGTLRWSGHAQQSPGAIAYMPQDNASRVALTAFEVVLLGRLRSLTLRVAPADLAAAEAAMAELGIAALAARLLAELSGGQRQLVFLAQVLAGSPRALLLDEPTSALDIAHQLHVLELLAAATRAGCSPPAPRPRCSSPPCCASPTAWRWRSSRAPTACPWSCRCAPSARRHGMTSVPV